MALKKRLLDDAVENSNDIQLIKTQKDSTYSRPDLVNIEDIEKPLVGPVTKQ